MWSRLVKAALKAAGPSILKVCLGGDRTGDAGNVATWDSCDSHTFRLVQCLLRSDNKYLTADLHTANGLHLAFQGVVCQY